MYADLTQQEELGSATKEHFSLGLSSRHLRLLERTQVLDSTDLSLTRGFGQLPEKLLIMSRVFGRPLAHAMFVEATVLAFP